MSLFVHQTTVLSRFTFRATRDLFSVLSGATLNGTAPALANGRASTHAKQSAIEKELRATLGNGKVSTFRLHVWISTGTRLLWRYVCAACRCSTEKPSVSVHAGGGFVDGSARWRGGPETVHRSPLIHEDPTERSESQRIQ